jgi:hypothetical protein
MPVVAEAATSAPAARPSFTPTPVETCPNCGAPRISGALFCESCGYDYTTGALPQQDLRAELGLPPVAAAAADANHVDMHKISSHPAILPTVDSPGSGQSPVSPPGSGEPMGQTERLVGADPGPATSSDPAPSGAAVSSPAGEPATRRPTKHVPYVAEVWVDPQWYAFQESDDPLPPQGPPHIVVLKDSALIGRRSVSRNIHPDIDCESDAGVSRRQAFLTSADGYWYINDLDSANGTYVGAATASLPDEPISGRTPLSSDTRIYVGAWTRIVVRPAIAGETALLTGTTN